MPVTVHCPIRLSDSFVAFGITHVADRVSRKLSGCGAQARNAPSPMCLEAAAVAGDRVEQSHQCSFDRAHVPASKLRVGVCVSRIQCPHLDRSNGRPRIVESTPARLYGS